MKGSRVEKIFIFSVLFTLCFTPFSLCAETLVVRDVAADYGTDTQCSTAAYTSIQDAVVASQRWDLVLVCRGTYFENIDFLGKTITVRSKSGELQTTINGDTDGDGNGDGSVVTFAARENAAAVLDGFTLTNGTGFRYLHVVDPADPYGCNDLENNVDTVNDRLGGGIYISGSSPTVKNCTITNNVSNSGGGVYSANGSPTFQSCKITNNTSTFFPEESTPTPIICQDFSFGGEGGGFFIAHSSSLIIDNCDISGNISTNGGGGIYMLSSSPQIGNTLVSSNTSDWGGGGIHCDNSSPTIDNCDVLFNKAYSQNGSGKGGGILCWSYSSPTIINSDISHNQATYGGGIHCDLSSPAITSCTIRYNLAANPFSGDEIPTTNNALTNFNIFSSGGGIYTFRSKPVISECDISYNEASEDGGGVYCENFLDEVLILQHFPDPQPLPEDISPVLLRCDITSNVARRNGGGIAAQYGASPKVVNCLFSKNAATGYGGALYAGDYFEPCDPADAMAGIPDPCWLIPTLDMIPLSEPRIINSTLSDNVAVSGGAVFADNNSLPMFLNSILWGNLNSEIGTSVENIGRLPDGRSAVADGSVVATYSNVAGGYAGTGNIDSDPMFEDRPNGDYHLMLGSPSVNSGTDVGDVPLDDRDGTPRPQPVGGDYDMGAYELCDTPVSYYLDSDRDGYGNPAVSVNRCTLSDGYVSNSLDCDDSDSSLNPDTLWYEDVDGDGYGDVNSSVSSCTQPPNNGQTVYVRDNSDCSDSDATLNPDTPWYEDKDGDNYGDEGDLTPINSCTQPPDDNGVSYVRDNTDCDDNDLVINPGTEWYEDVDGDGYGDGSGSSVFGCTQPPDNGSIVYVSDGTDCDDTDDTLNPDTPWYEDSDADGFGDVNDASPVHSCTQPLPNGSTVYSRLNTDCDDSVDSTYPGAQELCNMIDDDCDGLVEGGYTVIQLSANIVDDKDPAINSNRQVVWSLLDDSGVQTTGRFSNPEGDDEIVMYDDNAQGADQYVNISNNAYNDITPDINDNGDITWVGVPSAGRAVFLYDATTKAITNVSSVVPYNPDPANIVVYARLILDGVVPQINNSKHVLWSEGIMFYDMNTFDDFESTELYLYTGDVVTPYTTIGKNTVMMFHPAYALSNNGDVAWVNLGAATIYKSGQSSVMLRSGINLFPRINDSGDTVWYGNENGDREIFFYSNTDLPDPASVIPLTVNTVDDEKAEINGMNDLVWRQWDGNDFEIFVRYSGVAGDIQITNNTYDDDTPKINDNGELAWRGEVSAGNYDIFAYDGTREPVDVTAHITNVSNSPDSDEGLQMNEYGDLVWMSKVGGGDYEVFFARHSFCVQVGSLAYSNLGRGTTTPGDERGCERTWFMDYDGDGYSDGESIDGECDRPENHRLVSELESIAIDCDDADASINPSASEICGDAIDQDCSGGDALCSGSPKISMSNMTYKDASTAAFPQGATLVITANIIDDGVVTKVTLFYRPANSAEGTAYFSKEMNRVSGELWSASILPGESPENGVDYYIVAEDDEQNTSVTGAPEESKAVPTLNEWGLVALLLGFVALFRRELVSEI